MRAYSWSKAVFPTPPGAKMYRTLNGGSAGANHSRNSSSSAARPTKERCRDTISLSASFMVDSISRAHVDSLLGERHESAGMRTKAWFEVEEVVGQAQQEGLAALGGQGAPGARAESLPFAATVVLPWGGGGMGCTSQTGPSPGAPSPTLHRKR